MILLLNDFVLYQGNTVVKKVNLGEYIGQNVPSLKHFMTSDDVTTQQEFCIPSLMALSSSMRLLQRYNIFLILHSIDF